MFGAKHDKMHSQIFRHPVPDLGSSLASSSVLEEFSFVQIWADQFIGDLSLVGVYPLPIAKFLTPPP